MSDFGGSSVGGDTPSMVTLTRTHGTSIGTKSGIALPSISNSNGNGNGFDKPRSYRAVTEGQDVFKSTQSIWSEVKDNVTNYIFPSAEQSFVPFAFAKLVTYAKYGPAVTDHKDGTLRLRGSQRLLMPHEEAALVEEEKRAMVFDIFMLKSKHTQGGKRSKVIGGGGLGGVVADTGESGREANDTRSSSNNTSTKGFVSMRSLAEGSTIKKRVSVVETANSSKEANANKQANASSSAPTTSTTTAGGSTTATSLMPPKVLKNTLTSPTNSLTIPSSSRKGTHSASPNQSTADANDHTLRRAVAAANTKATALSDAVYGIEMLDHQHPMAGHVLEMTREELRQLQAYCESTLPSCEKDGSRRLKRSTIVDHFADVIFCERDRRLFSLKRSDTQFDDVRTDSLLTKRKETTIYNKTTPPAFSITCYDQPHHVQRSLHRRAFQVVNIADGNNPQVVQNVRCIRDEFRIAPGTVKEGWDGYCCIRQTRYGGGPAHKHTMDAE